jgi:hypothetical protein
MKRIFNLLLCVVLDQTYNRLKYMVQHAGKLITFDWLKNCHFHLIGWHGHVTGGLRCGVVPLGGRPEPHGQLQALGVHQDGGR